MLIRATEIVIDSVWYVYCNSKRSETAVQQRRRIVAENAVRSRTHSSDNVRVMAGYERRRRLITLIRLVRFVACKWV